MKRKHPALGLLVVLAIALACARPVQAAKRPATLILTHGRVWTVDAKRPRAEAVAVAGDRIERVGSDQEVLRLKGPHTRVIDLKGAMVLPGFIDTHTHFGNAVSAFSTARVIDLDNETALAARLIEAARRLPSGRWLTGADLQGQEAAAAQKRNDTGFSKFTPSLAALDAAVPDHPVLIRRFDGVYFANTAALNLAQLTPDSPNPPNGDYVRQPGSGALTGELRGSAGTRMAAIMPPHTRAGDAFAAQAIVKELNALGIVGVHDIARLDAASQRQVFAVDVERSFTDMNLFYDLRKAGKLTLRVYPLLSLAGWREYKALGVAPGSGDDLIRYGGLKVLLDSSYMYQPLGAAKRWAGSLSYRVTDLARLRADIAGADRLGFDIAVHVIGDKAHDMLLDDYAATAAANSRTDRRFRLIHMWYPTFAQVKRAGAARDIADIQPYQLIEQVNSIDGLLGPDRAKSAFPWRTAIAAGMILDLGSDWPGSYDGIEIAPNNPLENIYYAVTRSDLSGAPRGGWHPEQALTVEQAIQAYTLNPAYASHEEQVKGSITRGKLADMVVLSDDILVGKPEQLLTTRVLYTIFGGRIVYKAPTPN